MPKPLRTIRPAVVAEPTATPAQGTSHAAIGALSAMAQPTRLEIFRLLIRREPHGMAAGAIADALNVPANTMSTHLGILARAGLITGTRDGRTIVYRADIAGMRDLVSFLLDDCCNGHPELCGPDNLPVARECWPTPVRSTAKRRGR